MKKRIVLSFLLISIMLYINGCLFLPEKDDSYEKSYTYTNTYTNSYTKKPEEVVISGRIIDATTLEPISEVSVAVRDLSVSSDENGKWEISFPVSDIAKYAEKEIEINRNSSESEIIRIIHLNIFKDGYFTVKKIIPISFNSNIYYQDVSGIELHYGSELVSDLENACDISFSLNYYKKSTGQYVYRIFDPIYILPKRSNLKLTDIYSSLLPSYLDIKDLFLKCAKLEDNFPRKDKFETTEQYKKRVKDFKYPEDVLNQFFVFSFLVSNEYNADKGLLKIDLSSLIKDNRIILDIDIETTEYIATNAFGAQVKVKSQKITNYGIVTKNGDLLKNKIFKAHIMPEDAKSLLSNLKGLGIFRLSPGDFPVEGEKPSSKEDYSLSIPENYRLINRNLAVKYLTNVKPTFSNPYELFSHDILINTMLYEIIIYNKINQDVILRLRLSEE